MYLRLFRFHFKILVVISHMNINQKLLSIYYYVCMYSNYFPFVCLFDIETICVWCICFIIFRFHIVK